MKVERLQLTDFRNYENQQVSFSDNINVITGKNAQGKTNLLEAVYYLTGAKSFRAGSDRELIQFEKDNTRLQADIFSEGRRQNIQIDFGHARRKKICVNGVRLKTASELSGKLTAVLFSPEDLAIIQSSPICRRRLMDSCLCQMRPRYAACLTEYHKLYEAKTRILRDNDFKMQDVLQDFSERMCETGAVILYFRARFVRLLAEIAAEIHHEFSGKTEQLNITYQTVKSVKNPYAETDVITGQLMDHMNAHAAAEAAVGRCLSGIHKDDLLLTVNGQEARRFASQGQARTAAISLKMAEREILQRDSGECPVLLLDDVLSELDAGRQDFILNRIGNGQVLITCCEDKSITEKTGGRVLTVSSGRIFEED